MQQSEQRVLVHVSGSAHCMWLSGGRRQVTGWDVSSSFPSSSPHEEVAALLHAIPREGGGSGWVSGSLLRGWSGMEQSPQDTELPEFEKCLHNALRWGLNFGWSCVGPDMGLDNPCGSLPTQALI